MPYAYEADLYCDACGEELQNEINVNDPAAKRSGDTDEYPQYVDVEEESDSIYHCANGRQCKEAIDLHAWGLKEDDQLQGSETPLVGELLTENLTPEGVEYLKRMLDEPNPTPYQIALHECWKAAFAHYL